MLLIGRSSIFNRWWTVLGSHLLFFGVNSLASSRKLLNGTEPPTLPSIMLERVKSRPEPSGEKHSCRQHFNDRSPFFTLQRYIDLECLRESIKKGRCYSPLLLLVEIVNSKLDSFPSITAYITFQSRRIVKKFFVTRHLC